MAKRNYFINPEECIDDIVDWIKDYFSNFDQNTKAIIGMSGGKDSTVAAALLVRALGPDRVIGVIMPNIAPQTPLDTTSQFTIEICESLGIQYYVLRIGDIVSSLYLALPSYVMSEEGVYNNTPPRVRMSVLYGLAAATHGRVVNTCNRSETYVGWETKWGDNVGDFSLFKNYLATQVIEIGHAMPELKDEWVNRTPDDGLCGMSDEEKFGFTYEELDDYILNHIVPENVNTLYKIKKMFNAAEHKARSVHLPTPAAYLDWEGRDKEDDWF